MTSFPLDRRSFLTVTAGAAAALLPSRAHPNVEAVSKLGRIRLGGPIFIKSDPRGAIARAT